MKGRICSVCGKANPLNRVRCISCNSYIEFERTREINDSTTFQEGKESSRSGGDASPYTDEDLYLLATEEVGDLKKRDAALWAKSMALSEGDKEKAKYKYISLRVGVLLTNISGKRGEPEGSISVSNNLFSKLAKGDFGLAKTYWLYGVLVGTVINIIAKLIASRAVLLVLLLGYTVYGVPVLLGIWRASDRYAGPTVWAVLAKIAVVLGWFGLGITLFSALALLNA